MTFCIGIDLGTSNSAVAVCLEDGVLEATPILQVVAPAKTREEKLLPSALYLPHPAEFAPESLALPWNQEAATAPLVGSFAREHGALVPDRLITSAKSWLCNGAVDRRSAILPWGSDLAEAKLSPFDVSRVLLEHLRHALLTTTPALVDGQEPTSVVVTVPASFDEAARALTQDAARAAGWGDVVLFEEPLAAFYAWIAATDGGWREQIDANDLVLVCDVGGGTSDFSLIAVGEQDGKLDLRRVSVGRHLLLGGDNMDLTLAFVLRGELESQGQTIDEWQFLALIQLVRDAKERLLKETELDRIALSLPSRGSNLFRSTVTTHLERAQVEQVLVEGFFPLTDPDELPQEQAQSGLAEFGLPYAADPALSRHLAAFLQSSMMNVRSNPELADLVGRGRSLDGEVLLPNKVLFNGGVFGSTVLRERVLELLRRWSGNDGICALVGEEPELAVAKGAAAYARLRESGEGLRVRAGTARSFYLGVETSMPAVPGYRPPVKGLCIVPQGIEEGTSLPLPNREFGLRVGEQVRFRLFSSAVRAGDEIGAVVSDAVAALDELPALEVAITPEEEQPGELVPVRLEASVTELGALELWMQHTRSSRRWKLEFNLRGAE
ncbi:MAG: Hsp70 family protein [Bdellovibrionales bacterium]|nr:Hsp70 family protein [Bdellovibrionales bacterium]